MVSIYLSVKSLFEKMSSKKSLIDIQFNMLKLNMIFPN